MDRARAQQGMENRIGFAIEGSLAHCAGNWAAQELHNVEKQLSHMDWPADTVQFDLSRMSALDTAGAWLLHRTIIELEAQGRQVSVLGANEQIRQLLDLVKDRSETVSEPPKPYIPGLFESVGRHTGSQFQQYFEFLNFIGKLAIVAVQVMLRPWRIRWSIVIKELQSAGVNALPIVGLLSFLIGVVIAYQGGMVLRDYGANIYVADIVGLSMVRELAPLITAIIVAGRTGSAYTAQIGTMMVTEEVDALRSIGVDPLEMLVLPKMVALVVALPLLTVFADVMGLFGGMIMSSAMLGLNSVTFIDRLTEAVSMNSYLSGIGKAPVFAAIIAAVGCFQGFRVYGSAESVGRQTTISVVQSIFLVIIVDAVFSVAFSKLGI
jgi:phospholipid/cholesterol/gamma-HCH transport system permease protein